MAASSSNKRTMLSGQGCQLQSEEAASLAVKRN